MKKNHKGLLGRPSRGLAAVVLSLFVGIQFLPGGVVMPREAGAQYLTPTVGDEYLPPSEAPCIPYEVGPATGTTEALIVSGTTASPSKGWVSWVSVSTAPAESYLVLKDTGSLNNSGVNTLTGRIHFTTAAAVGVSGMSVYPTQVVRYTPPVWFSNGLTAKATGCAGGCFATVCYRKAFRQQTP